MREPGQHGIAFMTDASDLEPPSHGALDAVHALWDRLAAYPRMEIDEACRFLMGCLGEWLQADNAAWIGTIRLLSGPLARRGLQDLSRGLAKPVPRMFPHGWLRGLLIRGAPAGPRPAGLIAGWDNPSP